MKKGAAKKSAQNPRWVAVSGGFDPIHIGHIRMLKRAKKLGDKLVVIINNDNWLQKKKGYAFMPQKERLELIESLPFVDKGVLTSHTSREPQDAYHMSVSRVLAKLKPKVFANGGDRDEKNAADPNSSLYWDIKTCQEHGIRMVFNVGEGGKVQSSSWMLQKASKPIKRTVRPWGEYYGWDQGGGWNLKTIYIKPKSRLSLQYHHFRTECWLLVEGDAVATVHDTKGKVSKITLKKGVTQCIGKKQVHRLESKKGGVVVEVAYGKFDEDDIVRLEDDHGRPTKRVRS